MIRAIATSGFFLGIPYAVTQDSIADDSLILPPRPTPFPHLSKAFFAQGLCETDVDVTHGEHRRQAQTIIYLTNIEFEFRLRSFHVSLESC